MAAYYAATVDAFLRTDSSAILSELHARHAREFSSFLSDGQAAWEDMITCLQRELRKTIDLKPSALRWTLLLEYSMYRLQQRSDAIILALTEIAVLEFKTADLTLSAIEQVEDYALGLHYFHGGSHALPITPILITTKGHVPPGLASAPHQTDDPAQRVRPVVCGEQAALHLALHALDRDAAINEPLDPVAWQQSGYYPVPSMIQAALALSQGFQTTDIAFAEAAQHDIDKVVARIRNGIAQARQNKQHHVYFLTGVPGSGKTLVGLSLAFHPDNTGETASAVHFMSGNGPLVKVLQAALARDFREEPAPL